MVLFYHDADGELYSGTAADFMGRDFAIFRTLGHHHPIRARHTIPGGSTVGATTCKSTSTKHGVCSKSVEGFPPIVQAVELRFSVHLNS